MNLTTALIEHFLNMPFQNFTEKLIAGFQLIEVIKFSPEDELRLKFIEENTHEDIMVSIYMLDRFVNPTKGDFKIRNVVKEFRTNIRNIHTREYQMVSIPEDKAQRYLCLAMREVCQIISRNIKGYNDEIVMPDMEKGGKNGFST